MFLPIPIKPGALLPAALQPDEGLLVLPGGIGQIVDIHFGIASATPAGHQRRLNRVDPGDQHTRVLAYCVFDSDFLAEFGLVWIHKIRSGGLDGDDSLQTHQGVVFQSAGTDEATANHFTAVLGEGALGDPLERGDAGGQRSYGEGRVQGGGVRQPVLVRLVDRLGLVLSQEVLGLQHVLIV